MIGCETIVRRDARNKAEKGAHEEPVQSAVRTNKAEVRNKKAPSLCKART